jgi:hypothetical protein
MPKKSKQTKKTIKPKSKSAAETVTDPKKTSTVKFPGDTW